MTSPFCNRFFLLCWWLYRLDWGWDWDSGNLKNKVHPQAFFAKYMPPQPLKQSLLSSDFNSLEPVCSPAPKPSPTSLTTNVTHCCSWTFLFYPDTQKGKQSPEEWGAGGGGTDTGRTNHRHPAPVPIAARLVWWLCPASWPSKSLLLLLSPLCIDSILTLSHHSYPTIKLINAKFLKSRSH